MTKRMIFPIDENRCKVPNSPELYLKNLDYFRGMGMYDEAVCHEKALLTTGYSIVEDQEQDH